MTCFPDNVTFVGNILGLKIWDIGAFYVPFESSPVRDDLHFMGIFSNFFEEDAQSESTMSKEPIVSESERLKILRKLTGVAKKGLIAFHQVGEALRQIRDDELWRLEAETFDQWCCENLKMQYGRVNQLITLAKTLDGLVESGFTKLPADAKTARALVGLNDADAADAWRESLTVASEPTPQIVRGIVARRKKTGITKPLAIRVPGCNVRLVPRKRGFVSYQRALEQAIQILTEQAKKIA